MDDRSAPSSEPIVIVEPEAGESGKPCNAGDLLRQYVDEAREQLDIIANPLPDTRGQRWAAWVLGAVAVLVLAAIGAVALTRTDSVAEFAARAQALHEQNVCVRRQETVMRAIAQYTQDHREPPKDLSVLRPPYLDVPPVDPVSGVPYQYARQGNAVRLSCAQHPLRPGTATR